MNALLSLAVQPLFADIGGLIGIIIWVIIMVVSAVGKMNGGKKGPPKRKPGFGQPGMGMPPQQPQARGGAGPKSIEMEIEDFLRQARGGQAQPSPVQTATKVRQPPATGPQGRPPYQPRVIEAAPVEQDIVPGKGFGKGVSQHVREHIGQDSISTRDAHLAETIEEADERIEHHLEEVFDHDVGHLENVDEVNTSIAEGTDAVESAGDIKRMAVANRIREMLGNPDSIREVFIAAEILKRPDFD